MPVIARIATDNLVGLIICILNPVRGLANPLESNNIINAILLNDRIAWDQNAFDAFSHKPAPPAPMFPCNFVMGLNFINANAFRISAFGSSFFADYEWTVRDGNGNIIQTASTPIFLDIPVNSNTVYPLLVTLCVDDNFCEEECKTLVIQEPPVIECNFQFAFFETNDINNFHFYISAQPACCNIVFEWQFEGTNGTFTGDDIDHDFGDVSGVDTRTVTVTMIRDGCTSTKTFEIVFGCGDKGKTQKQETNYNRGNRKLRGKLWMNNNIFSRGVFARGRNYRKKWWGWKRDNATQMTLQWDADSRFIRGNCNNFQELPDAPFVTTNNNQVSNSWHTGEKVRVRPGEVNVTMQADAAP